MYTYMQYVCMYVFKVGGLVFLILDLCLVQHLMYFSLVFVFMTTQIQARPY